MLAPSLQGGIYGVSRKQKRVPCIGWLWDSSAFYGFLTRHIRVARACGVALRSHCAPGAIGQLAKQKVRFLLCSIFQTLACLKDVRRILAPLQQAAENSFQQLC
jgi:hypothetical protein